MFMTHCWQVAAYLDRPVVLYRTGAGGAVVAMEDRCPHRHAPLSLGRLDGDVVQCGYHGMRFGPSGACEAIRRSVADTFDQDKVVLEAQQVEIDQMGSMDPGLGLGVDAGLARESTKEAA